MSNVRTPRLAHQLLSRQAVHYDVATKERLIFRNRYKALIKYADEDNIFGSFTRLPKLGLNPKSTYKTPIGVYSYPVAYILDNAVEDIFSVPFAADAPYLHIFRVSGLDRALKFDKSDRDKLYEFGAEAPDNFESEEYNEVKALVLRINNYVNSTIDEIPEKYHGGWIRSNWERWYRNLMDVTEFEYDPDDEISYIIMNFGGLDFYQQDQILRRDRFPLERVLEEIRAKMWRLEQSKTVMFPYEDRIIELPEVKAMRMEAYAKFKSTEVLGEGERVACDQAFAWNCTRHLSKFNPAKWTGLMRRIGLIGAIDDETGTIHPNESTQAVFFDPSSIQRLEVIHNEPPVKEGYYVGESLSKWAADVDKHIKDAVNAFGVSLRQFLRTGTKQSQSYAFAKLSWLQQYVREYFRSHPKLIEGFVNEIYHELDNPFSNVDRKALNKIIQILERFLR